MDGNFLIPANSKKSMLIFGLFKMNELIMFGTGIGITLLLLIAIPLDGIVTTVIALAPALITGFLVMPVPNYHNVMTLLQSMIAFYGDRQKFVWRGWCFLDGKDKK